MWKWNLVRQALIWYHNGCYTCYQVCAVYDECKYSDAFWFADRTRLFVQYIILLSSLCKLIWRHWTYKMPVRYILSSMWVRLSIFSSLSIKQHVRLYVFSLPISIVMIERIYVPCLIIIYIYIWYSDSGAWVTGLCAANSPGEFPAQIWPVTRKMSPF